MHGWYFKSATPGSLCSSNNNKYNTIKKNWVHQHKTPFFFRKTTHYVTCCSYLNFVAAKRENSSFEHEQRKKGCWYCIENASRIGHVIRKCCNYYAETSMHATDLRWVRGQKEPSRLQNSCIKNAKINIVSVIYSEIAQFAASYSDLPLTVAEAKPKVP